MSLEDNDEKLPLIRNSDAVSMVTISKFEPEEKQSVASCVFNFLNSCLGSGVLAVPYVYKLCGYVFGPMLTLIFCFLAIISFFMLFYVSEYTNRYQFDKMAYKLYDGKSLGLIAIFAELLFISGCLISYVIVIRDNFWFFDLENDMLYANIVLAAIMLFIVMPLCYLKTLERLKFNSYLVFIVIFYILFVLFGYFCDKSAHHKLPITRAFEAKLTILNAFSLTIHSFNAHYNFLNLIYELKDRSKNFVKVVFYTLGMVVFIYITIGLFGYLEYGEDTESDILISMQEENSVFTTIANAGMIFFMVCHYPLAVYAMRRGVESLLEKNKNQVEKPSTRYIIATIIIVCSLVLGMFIKSIDMVLDFTSSLAGGFEGYIFPGIAYARTMKLVGEKNKYWVGIVYAALGIVITLVAFTAAIWKWGWNHGEI